jgi:glycogen synthase
MRVCFDVDEIFAFGSYGGYGSLTRAIGDGLAKRGGEVFVVTPKRFNQRTFEYFGDITVIGLPWKCIEG